MPSHRNYRALSEPGLELLSAAYHGQRFVPHAHEHLVLAVTDEGRAVVRSGSRSELLQPGSVLVIPPHVVHDAASVGGEPWVYRAFYLAPAVVERHASWTRPPNPLEPAVAVLHRPHLAGQLSDLHRVVEATGDAPALLDWLGPELGGILEPAYRVRPAADPPPRAVILAKALIDADPERRWSLRDLAAASDQSRFHLCRSFHRHVGASPYAYALQRRVARARDRLRSSARISQIAHQLGFADQSHFTRLFLQVFGLTPGEFRRGAIR